VSSENHNNTDWVEQIGLLHRAVRQADVFKFIVLRYNHFSAVTKVERDLKELDPNRPLLRLRAEREDYYSLIQKIEQHTGFVLIEDFQYLASTAAFFIGFNQRRDYLSKLPIQLLCFLPQGAEYIRTCMDNLRDWWSIRNFVLELRVEVDVNVIESMPSIDSISTLGGITEADKRKELVRILARIESLKPTAENSLLLLSLYPQAHQLYLDLGEYSDALKLAETWLHILELHTYSKEERAFVYGAIGENYRLLGDFNLALEYDQHALAIREKVLPMEHPVLASSYNNLAVIYGELGEYKKALDYHQKALATWEKLLPPEHPDLAGSYNNLAGIYGALGEHEIALEYHQKALVTWGKVLPQNHPYFAGAYNNLALTYYELGEYQKSLEYNQKALSVYQKVLSPDHPNLAQSYNNLAVTYGALGKHQKALEYYLKSLDIREKVLSTEHPVLAETYNNLAWTYHALGRLEQALGYMKKAVVGFEKSLPSTHLHVKMAKEGLVAIEKNLREKQA